MTNIFFLVFLSRIKMTIIELQNQIHSHFLLNDTFVFPDDVKKIKVDKHQIQAKENIVLSVLKIFEEAKMVLSSKIDDKTIHFTVYTPIGSDGQEVKISQVTAELVAEIVNQYRSANQISGGLVDKLNITDRDIQTLGIICTELMKSLDTKDEDV